jgi:hypothetical protein
MAWWTNMFRGNSDDDEIHTQEVPLSTVYRWYLYDTELVDNVNDLAEMVGLSRISEEGESKEQEDSKTRVAAIAPLFPFLESIADVSAKSLCALHLTELLSSEEDVDDHELEHRTESMMDVYKAVALSTLMGAFSIGLHLGMIETNTVNSDVLEFGEIDE